MVFGTGHSYISLRSGSQSKGNVGQPLEQLSCGQETALIPYSDPARLAVPMHDFAFFSLRTELSGLIGVEELSWRPHGEIVIRQHPIR